MTAAETLLYNKFRREGYDAKEAARLAKLNAPYYDRGRKSNPPAGRKMTKLEKKVKAAKAAAKRRVAVALAKYLKQQNPGTKFAGAQIQKLKGGVLKITPVKANKGPSKASQGSRRFRRATGAKRKHYAASHNERLKKRYKF